MAMVVLMLCFGSVVQAVVPPGWFGSLGSGGLFLRLGGGFGLRRFSFAFMIGGGGGSVRWCRFWFLCWLEQVSRPDLADLLKLLWLVMVVDLCWWLFITYRWLSW